MDSRNWRRTVFLEDTLIMAEGQRHNELKQLFAPLLSRQSVAYYALHLVERVIQSGKDALATLVDEYLQASLARRIDLVKRHRAGAEQAPHACRRDALAGARDQHGPAFEPIQLLPPAGRASGI